MDKRLYRSKSDRMIAGVCGGLGDYFDIDSSLIRLAVLLIFLFQGIGLIAYIIAWIIISEEPVRNQSRNYRAQDQRKQRESEQKDFEFEREENEEDSFVNKNQKRVENVPYQENQNYKDNKSNNRRQLFAMIMILLGSVFLVDIWIPDFYWEKYWPLIFIVLGVLLLKGDHNDSQ